MKEEILEELNIKEDHERECKLATGGLPESIWETYSSFANTNGGTILLGIREHRDSFTVEGLTDKQIVKYQKDFWSTLNDRNKVSKNILLNHHVRPVTVGEKKILRIDVPAADRHDKPVYIGTDPMKGTYKRDYEGDFLCTEEAVRAMFADQRDVSGDVEVLEEFGLDVLNQDTIKGYRIIFEQLHSAHPWNALENDEFLMKLRAAAKNKNGTLSPTIAGLLFFGEAYHITEVFPNYFLDYREECDDKAVRWLFRTHSNEGDWRIQKSQQRTGHDAGPGQGNGDLEEHLNRGGSHGGSRILQRPVEHMEYRHRVPHDVGQNDNEVTDENAQHTGHTADLAVDLQQNKGEGHTGHIHGRGVVVQQSVLALKAVPADG